MKASSVSEALREGPTNPKRAPLRRAGADGVPLPGTLPRFLGYEHFQYTPYGESWVEEHLTTQLNETSHRFTGQELDEETGLYAFPARYYDPQTSRWMGADPAMGEYLPAVGQGPGDLPGMGGVFDPTNLAVYHYASNNPLRYVDPTGRNDELNLQYTQDLSGGGGSIRIADPYTEERIEELHPDVRDVAKQFILDAQAEGAEGIVLRITSAYRSSDEQDDLYAIGRDEDGNLVEGERAVTNAQGGESYHNYGLALDVVEIKDGKALWVNENWDRIGELGELRGFEWGGRWEGFPDRPHFQMPFGQSIEQLQSRSRDGKVDANGFIILD